ncbi:MAG: inorganic phosphate transporter [Clostridia bacterium]|nr:inorganic phosphate transporter [Clostridia bacterium]
MLMYEVFGQPVIFWILSVLTFSLTLLNGFLDGSNTVATLIASRSMRPRTALRFAAAIEFVSPLTLFVTGFGVSRAIQNMVYEENYLGATGEDQYRALCFIGAGVLAAVLWDLTAWLSHVPSSSTHALLGGVVGSSVVAYGLGSVAWFQFLYRVILMIFLAPVVGFIAGFIVMKINKTIFMKASRGANTVFKRIQILNVLLLAYSHSTHDSQKTLGIIMLLMSICGGTVATQPPVLAVLVAGTCLATGILFGGYNIIRTVGMKIFKVKPIHAYSSQLASATSLITANALGVPVSSSHIVSTSVMGVGAAERLSAVRWINVKKIVISWFITVPIVGSLGALFCFILTKIVGV